MGKIRMWLIKSGMVASKRQKRDVRVTGRWLKVGGRKRQGRQRRVGRRKGVWESLERAREKSHWEMVLESLPWIDPVK
jgi:ribosomal protein L19E